MSGATAVAPPSALRPGGIAVACDHCALPVPAGLIEPGASRQFCCGGCRAVYTMILTCGLERFYELRERDDALRPATPTGARYEGYDDPAFAESWILARPDELASCELYLESVHCAACVWLVERLPRVLGGVVEVRADVGRQRAEVVWDPARVRLSEIARALDRLGYPSHPYRRSELANLRRQEERRSLVRIGVAGACAGNAMMFAFALWGGAYAEMEPGHRLLLRGASFAVAIVSLLWPGRAFYSGALASLRTRVPHMDLPIAIALTLGMGWGAVNTIRDTGEVYFESLTTVIFLLLVGRFIQQRQQRAAEEAVEDLFRLTPATARRIDTDGQTREVAVEALAAGDVVELRAGDSVPADGIVVEGRSEFDLSLLTGESLPRTLGIGEHAYAGTVNLSNRLTMRVQSTGAATRVGRLAALVENLARERPPLLRMADRLSHRFVIVVLALAAITAAVWLAIEPALAIEHAIALLIVTCPCALGLATPLAVRAAVGSAARMGILIKGGETIERLARPGIVLLDKTGTLTSGRMRLVEWRGDAAVKPWLLALERQVVHPIARALVEALEREGHVDLPCAAKQTLGGGVEGEVAGHAVLAGSPAFVTRAGVSLSPEVSRDLDLCVGNGWTPVVVAVDRVAVAVAALGDPLIPDAAASLAAIRRLGWRIGLVSGDHPAVVAAAAREVGITDGLVEGGASPERKLEIVRELAGSGETVVMVGDGVNDSAALVAAPVGVAVRGGAEASLSAADVYLSRPGLAGLVALFAGAPRAVGVIRRNLRVSLVYNAVTASLAVTGWIDPLLAALLMPASSLTVVLLSWRSRTFS